MNFNMALSHNEWSLNLTRSGSWLLYKAVATFNIYILYNIYICMHTVQMTQLSGIPEILNCELYRACTVYIYAFVHCCVSTYLRNNAFKIKTFPLVIFQRVTLKKNATSSSHPLRGTQRGLLFEKQKHRQNMT